MAKIGKQHKEQLRDDKETSDAPSRKLSRRINRSVTWREGCYIFAIGCKMLHSLLSNHGEHLNSAADMRWRWESSIATLMIPSIAGFVLNKKRKGKVNDILVRNLFFCGVLFIICLICMVIREIMSVGAHESDSVAPITLSTFFQYGLITAGTFGFSLFFFSSLY